MYNNNEFISAQDLDYRGVLKEVKKSKRSLQPIYEAITNSIESIELYKRENTDFGNGEIEITLYFSKNLLDNEGEFSHLTIIDNGIGFTDQEFKRFNRYKQMDKGFSNFGSGRIQFIHYFKKVKFESRYRFNNKYYVRKFEMSKSEEFLKNNAIVKHIVNEEIQDVLVNNSTAISFLELIPVHSKSYSNLTCDGLKDDIIQRYIHRFCYLGETMPLIKIGA